MFSPKRNTSQIGRGKRTFECIDWVPRDVGQAPPGLPPPAESRKSHGGWGEEGWEGGKGWGSRKGPNSMGGRGGTLQSGVGARPTSGRSRTDLSVFNHTRVSLHVHGPHRPLASWSGSSHSAMLYEHRVKPTCPTAMGGSTAFTPQSIRPLPLHPPTALPLTKFLSNGSRLQHLLLSGVAKGSSMSGVASYRETIMHNARCQDCGCEVAGGQTGSFL